MTNESYQGLHAHLGPAPSRWLPASLLLCMALTIIWPVVAQAENTPRVRWVGNMILEHQFKRILTVNYADATEVHMGNAMFGLNCGVIVPLSADGMFSVHAVGGFLLSKAQATNGSLRFWEFPVEVTANVSHGPVRFGLGPAVHIAPMLRGDGLATGSNLDFDTTLGLMAQISYVACVNDHGGQLSFGLRGSWMRLSARQNSSDASRLGMSIGYSP